GDIKQTQPSVAKKLPPLPGKELQRRWEESTRIPKEFLTSSAKIGSYLKRKLPPDNDNDTIGEKSTRENETNNTSERPQTISTSDIPSASEFRWLEYSVKVNKAFCLCCYLFRDNVEKQGGNDAFVVNGFDSWNKKDILYQHVGNVDSYHNRALQKCENLLKQDQSIVEAFNKKIEIEKTKYLIRLNASIDCVKLCMKTENPMRGHDEGVNSLNRGMYLEALQFLRDHNEEIRAVTLENAPKNCILTSPDIQKDIVECFAKEIVNSICLEIGDDLFGMSQFNCPLLKIDKEIGDDVFSLLVDESSDVVKKEQMAVVLRYLDKFGVLKERFIGIIHVENTSSTLKAAFDTLFNEHKLSLQQLRGQGYDGASNMRGEFNGLKSLILKENDSAYYVHCFAHQLQLVVVAVAKNHKGVRDFFDVLSTVTNVVCGSCKGKNQEVTRARAGDTRWGSHHRTITSLIKMFPDVLKVLHYVEEEGDTISNCGTTSGLIKKDQTILEAVALVKGTKRALQEYRATGFASLLKNVTSFCGKHDIEMVNMGDFHSRGRRDRMKNQHHFEVDIFNTIMDMQIREFGDRFSEGSTDLLDCMAALSPHDSFS
ncbi:zinc finger MYM-type protein 1-like protein, partial [Tanacetum coccineum]